MYRLIKSIQQGQRTTLVSLAKIVQDQKDEIEKYQVLLKLPEEVKQLQLRMEKLKKHVNTHLERIDKKTSVTSVTVSEIRSQIHRLETTMKGNFEHIPEPDKPSWVFPGDIVELHAPEDDILFHEECVSQIPSNGHQQQEESSTTGGGLQEEQDNIPHGQELRGVSLTHPHPPVKKKRLWRRGWPATSVTHHIEWPTQPS